MDNQDLGKDVPMGRKWPYIYHNSVAIQLKTVVNVSKFKWETKKNIFHNHRAYPSACEKI